MQSFDLDVVRGGIVGLATAFAVAETSLYAWWTNPRFRTLVRTIRPACEWKTVDRHHACIGIDLCSQYPEVG